MNIDFTNGTNPEVTVSLVTHNVMGLGNETKPQVTVISNDFAVANTTAGTDYKPLAGGVSVQASLVGSIPTFQGTSYDGSTSGSGTTPFIGFELNVNQTPLYGWADLTYAGGNAQTATLVDWAYQSNGSDILTGDTGMSAVPEPADTALFMGAAALLAGSATLWHKRQRGSVAA